LTFLTKSSPVVEGDLGDDVLLAEAARVDAGHGEGIAGVQARQDGVDDPLGLLQLARIGS
jgi:hypothetical protein